MDPHKKDKPLRSFMRYFLVFLLAMGVVWWLSSLGPDSVEKEASFNQELFDDQGQQVEIGQLLQQSQALEQEFEALRAESEALKPGAVILLEEAIRLQRSYVDRLGRVDIQAIARLKRLERRLHNEQADVLLDESISLENVGRVALSDGDQEAAAQALYQAAYLQKEINKHYPLSSASDYGRPVRLSRLIQDLEAKPLSVDSYRAEREAREALLADDKPKARAGFSEALDIQNAINSDYKNTQYVDLQRVRALESELQDLQARDFYETFSANLKKAKDLDKEKAFTQAVDAYTEALKLQETINSDYPASRYASAGRVSAIRGAIQIAQGQVVLEGLMEHLASLNQALAANQPEQAKLQLSQIKRDWASLKSKNALALQEHEGLVERVDYLVEHASSIDIILKTVYASLLPVPGFPKKRVFKTEVPQFLYRRVMDKNPSRNVGDMLPVDSVRYEDAELFCKRLTLLVGGAAALPEEALFKAALGARNLQALASESWNSSNSDYKTHPVGAQSPNDNGFFDLLGNVAEWLHVDSGVRASVAGGSFEDSPAQLESVPLRELLKSDRSRNVGFRFMITEEA